MTAKNNDSLTKLRLHKFQYACIIDDFEGKIEIRKIINFELQISQKRGESAGYVAATQLIGEGNKDDEGEDFIVNYVIFLHFMNAFANALALKKTVLILFSAKHIIVCNGDKLYWSSNYRNLCNLKP